MLEAFHVPADNLEPFAVDINRRMVNPINSQIHVIPNGAVSKKRPGRPPKKKDNTAENVPKRKLGRPKGSKNRKTLERETNVVEINAVKRGPGRPKVPKTERLLKRKPSCSSRKSGTQVAQKEVKTNRSKLCLIPETHPIIFRYCGCDLLV